jgi:PAS domain S-box-containing protein
MPTKPAFQLRIFALLALFLLMAAMTLLLARYSGGSHPDTLSQMSLFLKVCGGTVGGLAAYAFIRTLLERARPSTETVRETDIAHPPEGQFMMSTFQELIAQLKQKEQELEQLRAQADERARQVESYNENILQSVTSGVVTIDGEGKITRFNAAAGEILNLSPERVEGMPYTAIFGNDPSLTAMLQSPKTRQRREWRLRRADGKSVWLGLTLSDLHDSQRRPLGTAVVFADLTEIKALQDRVELKQRLALMGEMSAWIAHEFRNDIGTIFGFSKLLAKQLGPDHPGQEKIGAIHREIFGMERLITEMLSYAKTDEVQTTSLDLAALLRELADTFGQASPDIRWQLHVEEVALPLDPTLIRRAFSNLIQNAIEAMGGSGGVTIRLVRQAEGMTQARISDTGPGIAPEHLDRIFAPFFTTKEKGTGLGLALAHKIILAHNGRISADNLPDGGSTFTVDFPAPHLPILPLTHPTSTPTGEAE